MNKKNSKRKVRKITKVCTPISVIKKLIIQPVLMVCLQNKNVCLGFILTGKMIWSQNKTRKLSQTFCVKGIDLSQYRRYYSM